MRAGRRNSKVIRRDLSVYDLERDEIGELDFAFVDTLLLHFSERLTVAVAAPSTAAPSMI
jgi:hypothetical protein